MTQPPAHGNRSEAGAPEVSVVVVAFQSLEDLERCIPTVLSQDISVEVIVIDNGPDDGTESWLRRDHPQVRYLRAASNGGYAAGNNLGVGLARADHTLILNPDVELLPGALATLLATARAHPNAFINAQLRQPDGSLNACGNDMHYTGIVSCRALGDSPDLHQDLEDIPLLSGAAFLVPTSLYHHLGGFDELYFMYHEDTDLSLRARLQGLRLLCDNGAVAIHRYRLGMNPDKFYLLERNRLLTLLKVLEGRTLWRAAPALVLTELATWSFAMMRGPNYLLGRWRVYRWLWLHRWEWRAIRSELQSRRIVEDRTLLRNSLAALPFDQLVSSQDLARWLERLTRPLYVLFRPYRLGTGKAP